MSNEEQFTPPLEDDLPEQLRIRREKRAGLIKRGIEPYPSDELIYSINTTLSYIQFT